MGDVGDRSSICRFTLQIIYWLVLGQNMARSQELRLGLTHGWQNQTLSQLLLLFLRPLNVEQLGTNQGPSTWDFGITSSNLNRDTVMLTPVMSFHKHCKS